MKSIDDQLLIIQSLVGNNKNIKIKEDGFLSRGFVINNGQLVFKFPRNKNVSYETEIENLNFFNSFDLGVNLQKVAYASKDNEYLGVYGVLGKSLEEINLTEKEELLIGNQLGEFLKRLHFISNQKRICCTLNDEIKAWQNRVESIKDFIQKTFDTNEQKIIEKLMTEYIPNKLNELGENLVFSHGDLGDGNIFIDDKLNVGVIDFNESGLLDEAGDFMDISNENILKSMLDTYKADSTLREKIQIRKYIRPLIVLKPYLTRNNPQIIENLVSVIKNTLVKYEFLIN